MYFFLLYPENHSGWKFQCPTGNRDVITANVDLLIQNLHLPGCMVFHPRRQSSLHILSVFTEIKNHGYMKLNHGWINWIQMGNQGT
jgi:hypothetical protein